MLYFYSHLRDPGYVTNDAVFLTGRGEILTETMISGIIINFLIVFVNLFEARRYVDSSSQNVNFKGRSSSTELELDTVTTSYETKEKNVNIFDNLLNIHIFSMESAQFFVG